MPRDLQRVATKSRTRPSTQDRPDRVHRSWPSISKPRLTWLAMDTRLQDVPQALRLIAYLAQLPQPWNWNRVHETIQGIRLLIHADIPPAYVGEVCLLYERLVELGFDTRSVEALATLLEHTRSSRQRRSQLLAALVKMADDYVEVQDTLAQRAHLSRECDDLEKERDTLARQIEEAETRLATVQQQEAEARERLNHVEQEIQARGSELDVLQALKAVLLGRPSVG